MSLRDYTESVLAEKIKSYEKNSETYLDSSKPCFIRCDGRRFSKFTKGFDKPFDKVFRDTMTRTMLSLLSEVQGAIMGYTQSDEITIMFQKMSEESEIMFSGRVQKIVSEMSSMATLFFNKYFIEEAEKTSDSKYKDKYMMATFDCRVFNVDENPMEVFIWRCLDCQKNAIQMIARSHFSHKEINNKNLGEMKAMLKEKGIIVNDFNKEYIFGVIATKEEMILNIGTDRECVRNKFVPKCALEILDKE